MPSVIRSTEGLGLALRQARQAASLTQRQLAERTNLRQATISNLEKGEGANLDTVFAVMTFLKLEMQLSARSTDGPALEDIF